MVTINQLDVQMDVEGEGDEAVFSRLFEKHINRWHRLERERKFLQNLNESQRSVGDRQTKGHE